MRRATIVFGILVLAATEALALDITECGTNVSAEEVGELLNDLDCSSVVGHCVDAPDVTCSADTDCPLAGGSATACVRYGVRLASKATLHMNGHAIVGSGDGSTTLLPTGVLCRGRDCVVDGGGGSITGFQLAAIWHWGRRTMTVSNVELHDSNAGILTAYFAQRLYVTNVTATSAILAVDVQADGLTLLGAGLGCGLGNAHLYGRRIRGSNITATFVDAAKGLDATNLTVAADCGWGVVVRNGRLRLADSSITGAMDFDVVSKRVPLFTNVTCGTSSRYVKDVGATGETWGVCAND